MQFPTLAVQDGFIDASGIDGNTNIMPAAWSIAGRFTALEILAGVQEVAEAHQALRTTILSEAGTYGQLVVAEVDVASAIDVIDLTDSEDPEGAMSWLMGEYLSDPFNLGTAPLWRGFLARIDDRLWVLGLGFAHVICDGTSVSVFASDLAAALGGDPLADLPQLGRLAEQEQAIRPTPEQEIWWRGQYAQRRGLPATWEGAERAHFRVHPIPAFSADTLTALTRVWEACGASVSTTFGALVAVAAAAVLDVQPMMGFTTAQRTADNGRIFGTVHDHLPVLALTDLGMPFAEFLGDLHARRQTSRDRRLPSGVLGGIAGSTPYDIAVNYAPFAAPETAEIPGGDGTVTARPIATIGHVGVYRATTVAPATAAILRPREGGGVTGDFVGISALFPAVQVRRVALAIAGVAARVVDDPEQTIGSLVDRL